MVGGREQVDPNNPRINEIAAWAVIEYNTKHGTCLKFERVLKAEQEVMCGGSRYYIDLEASSINGWILQLNKYFAKVFEQVSPNQSLEYTRRLESFEPLVDENERTAVAN